ncbi:hypothetical protein HK405_012839, partial [Cladochytrium tenue]
MSHSSPTAAAAAATAVRQPGLRVIGAGLGRTGTASMQLALNILGFNCYHMND